MRLQSTMLFPVLLSAPLAASAGALVNINEAGVHEFKDNLIGVTKGQAQDIVRYRADNGTFDAEQDLLQVKGIERDFLNINRDYLHLGNDPRLDRRR